MVDKAIIENFTAELEWRFTEKLRPYLFPILEQYSLTDEVKWHSEYFENKNYNYITFVVCFIFLKLVNEDNYGFSFFFKITDGPSPVVTTNIVLSNGSIVIVDKKFSLMDLMESSVKLDDLINEYKVVAGLLIKEYVLEFKLVDEN